MILAAWFDGGRCLNPYSNGMEIEYKQLPFPSTVYVS